jgi:uncharacterized membrane protein YozB (DUF420 family)
MDTGLLHLHNLLRWVIVILLLVSLYKAWAGWQQKKVFSPADKKVWLFTMIAGHITLLVGLYQVLMGRFGILKGLPEGVDSVMKNNTYRFFWVEHPITMILAIVFLTLAHGMAKKQVPDDVKYRKAFIFLLLAFILLLAGVPWPFRGAEIGRPLIP